MVLPVLVRELKTRSRQAGTYWFRTAAAGIGVVLLAAVLASQAGVRSPSGVPAFLVLNVVLAAITWVSGPLLAADSVSGEKREGTLGLLFLTPLSVWDVITAKFFTQFWRAGSMLLAMGPLLLVPLVMGGVSWQFVIFVAAIHVGGLMVALMAGMLASSLGKELNRVRLLACGFGLGSAVLFATIVVLVSEAGQLFGAAAGAVPSFREAWEGMSENLIRGRVGDALSGISQGLLLPQLAAAGAGGMVRAAVGILAAGVLWAGVFWALAGAVLRKSRQGRSMTRRQWQIWRLFCSPLFWRELFARQMQRKRSANPVAWLDQYSWSGRMVPWGWCLFFMAIEFWLLVFWDPRAELARERVIGLFLAAAVGISAVGSFQQAGRSGLLELLLVSPVREWEIIRGRLKALLHQFLPSALVMAIIYCWLAMAGSEIRGLPGGSSLIARFGLIWGSIVVQCAAVAVVGMALALRGVPFLAAWVGTCLIVCAGPYLIGWPLWGVASLVGLVDGAHGPYVLLWRFVLALFAGWGICLLLIYGHAYWAGLLVGAAAVINALIDEGVEGHLILATMAQALIGAYALWRLYHRLVKREFLVS